MTRSYGLARSSWIQSGPAGKLAAIATAQAAGRLRAGDPADLLILLIGMASAWSPSSSVYTATTEEPDTDHDRRRALLRDVVTRTVRP